MNLGIEDYLQQIDTSFKDKNQNEVYMTYALIAGVIFAFSYLLFWESAEAEFNVMNEKVKDITKKINDDKTYLQRNPQSIVVNLERQIVKLKANLVIEKKNNAYIKSRIYTIPSLIYDEITWGEYLHSISTNAKKYKMMILDFENEYAENNESFGHILDISLRGTGSFSNTVKFIDSLEQSELVVDIHTLSIEAHDKLDTDINISVWGIPYDNNESK